jgi:hypothetical protein
MSTSGISEVEKSRRSETKLMRQSLGIRAWWPKTGGLRPEDQKLRNEEDERPKPGNQKNIEPPCVKATKIF